MVASVALLVWNHFLTGSDPLASAVPMQITRGESWEGSPAISPDGKQVAYVSNDSGDLDVFVTAVTGGQPLRITKHAGLDTKPSWLPDGSALIFVSDRSGQNDIWKVGPYGGTPTPLFPNATDPKISPDGTRLAFVRRDSTGMQRIGVVPLDDLSRVRILTGPGDGLWSHHDPAWSPDGRRLCYAAEDNLWVISADGGHARPLIPGGETLQEPVWSPDGKRIYFSSYGEGTAFALWWVSPQGGSPHRFTFGTGAESHPSLSENGLRMAYSTGTEKTFISLVTLPDGALVDLPGLWDCWMPALSPEGDRLAFVTSRWGPNADLWVQDLDEGKPAGEARRLFEDPIGNASHPTFSPDGRWIAYYRILGDARDIWIISAEGGQPIRFTQDPGTDMLPAWSPDGRTLAFVSDRDGTFHIWTASIDEGSRMGTPVRATDSRPRENAPNWSPDGQWIGFVSEGDIWVVPADRSNPPRQVTRDGSATRLRWVAEDTLLVSGSWESSAYSTRLVPLSTGTTIPLPNIGIMGYSAIVTIFDVSLGGGLLAITREDLAGDVWILDAEKDE